MAEIKWRRVAAAERRRILESLAARWARTAIGAQHPGVRFDVIDAGMLSERG